MALSWVKVKRERVPKAPFQEEFSTKQVRSTCIHLVGCRVDDRVFEFVCITSRNFKTSSSVLGF